MKEYEASHVDLVLTSNTSELEVERRENHTEGQIEDICDFDDTEEYW
jgi:hypothetical protein